MKSVSRTVTVSFCALIHRLKKKELGTMQLLSQHFKPKAHRDAQIHKSLAGDVCDDTHTSTHINAAEHRRATMCCTSP